MTSSTPQIRSTTTTSTSSSPQLLHIQNATADMTACTFAIRNEDHTLGNVIRHTLMQNETYIEFAGYSVPHPSEPIVQIRVQTRTDNNYNNRTTTTNQSKEGTTTTTTQPKYYTTAPQALQEACDTVSKQCDFVLDQLEQLIPYVKEDRIHMEQYNMEQNDDEEELEGEEEEVIEEDAQDENDNDDDDEMVEDV
jgi:DNA-directed RNA polymerases I and III subunit RPAC2